MPPPDSWLVVCFDHDRTEFRLSGYHFITQCRACHASDIWTGLPRECSFCHRGDRVHADATVPGHKLTSFSCGDDSGCHKAFAWKIVP